MKFMIAILNLMNSWVGLNGWVGPLMSGSLPTPDVLWFSVETPLGRFSEIKSFVTYFFKHCALCHCSVWIPSVF